MRQRNWAVFTATWFACATILFACVSMAAQRCASTATGDLRVQHFASVTFHDEQTLRVWLPPGYDSPENAKRSYPVLYMLDGENLFDVCTSGFHSEWRIDETLAALIGAGKVEPLIVVGIDSPGKRRTEEYLPFPDGVLGGGVETQGKLFPAFLVNEVLPVVRKQFRMKTGRQYTGIGGSSYGSVAALYALIMRPDVFGLGLLESTSAQAGNGEIVRMTSDLAVAPIRVSIGAGTDEVGEHPEIATGLALTVAQMNEGIPSGSRRIAENLKSSETGGSEVRLTITPGSRHEEKAWADRLPGALEFLFPVEKGE